MNVTQVGLLPTEESIEAGRPSLTPELLAASGARYSRSNEGLPEILSKIDKDNLGKSVDNIFKMIDYGHQSIADMAPVAIFMDNVSMWLAYYVWTLSPTAGGQESSTRYIKLSIENLPNPEEIGIPKSKRKEWHQAMEDAFNCYEKALIFWENYSEKNPFVMRLPQAVLEDTSEKGLKVLARMKRNYAFDRARYFLPAALNTNLMLVQSARAWMILIQHLLSHALPEANKLGDLLKAELALVTPRVLKHAEKKASFVSGIQYEFDRAVAMTRQADKNSWLIEANGEVTLDISDNDIDIMDLQFHDNRYAYTGSSLRMMPLKLNINGISLADLRDLNRHRTGSKYCDLIPTGFYGAIEQHQGTNTLLSELNSFGRSVSKRAREICLDDNSQTFVYWLLLGSQSNFHHTMTADKFIYETELRTGIGAHYRYAKHMHDALSVWYEKFPETKGLIIEGSAEPE